ncbi:MAG: conjugative transfer protein MobI(A/C) [Gallionella sp.]
MEREIAGNSLDVVVQSLLGMVEELGKEAEALCKQHLDMVMDGNKSRTWEDKSNLFAQTRVRGHGLTITWYEISWYGSKAAQTRRMLKKTIPRKRSDYGYNMDALLKRAKAWEEDIVREIEPRLREIRRQATFISKAIAQLNYAAKSDVKGVGNV